MEKDEIANELYLILQKRYSLYKGFNSHAGAIGDIMQFFNNLPVTIIEPSKLGELMPTPEPEKAVVAEPEKKEEPTTKKIKGKSDEKKADAIAPTIVTGNGLDGVEPVEPGAEDEIIGENVDEKVD